MEFVRIKQGRFLMGAPDGEEESEPTEKPQRWVEIARDFYLGKFVVTQAQYRAVSGDSPSHFKGDLLPVENVSWDEAVRFCQTVSAWAKRTLVLPGEAEWEYACRAGTTTPFHFGSALNGDLANCDGNLPYGTAVKGGSKKTTVKVGSYPANPWGLYDMHGNVFEWCQDYYRSYDEMTKEATLILPDRQDEERRRILRGGAWDFGAGACRAAYRFRSLLNPPQGGVSGLSLP